MSEFAYECVIAISFPLYTYFVGRRPIYHLCTKHILFPEAQIP